MSDFRCEEVAVAITGDHYVGTYAGHTIELVRDNWAKTLVLLIDGQEVARESRVLPHDITLTGTLAHEGVRHTVVATARRHLLTSVDTIEVDGQPLLLTKTR
jgi:hypothetical protein